MLTGVVMTVHGTINGRRRGKLEKSVARNDPEISLTD
jgi:hypothetical protein